MRVAVIGAGVVGATTALSLTEHGFEVNLLERHPVPAAETSHANGACITPGHAEPWNPPGIGRRLVHAVSSSEPFHVHRHAWPGLVGWGLKFLYQSTPERYFRNARAATRLAVYSHDCLVALRARHRLNYHQFTEGSMELYFNAQSLDHALSLRRRIGHPGVRIEPITAEEIVAREPALAAVAKHLHAGLWMPLHESGDAREFTAAVVTRAQLLGADIRFNYPVKRLSRKHDQWLIATDRGEPVAADAVVLAAGCGSPALAWPLGLKLPIYPVKGYSVTVELNHPERAPRIPLLDLERRIVTARFGDRLRVAGLADFDGSNVAVRPERLELLLRSACTLLPELTSDIRSGAAEPWAGLRPMTPRGTPMLGATAWPGLYLNTGHGSMGWTQAAGSAAVITDLLLGRRPAIDLSGLGG